MGMTWNDDNEPEPPARDEMTLCALLCALLILVAYVGRSAGAW